MPKFDEIRRFLIVPAIIDERGNKEPDLPDGVIMWVGNDILPGVYVIMTTDDIKDPPRAGVDFDPLEKAREIRDAKKEDLPAIRINNDASDEDLDAMQSEMGVTAGRRLKRSQVNAWKVRGR